MSERVAVAMSGGVDSSVAAGILKEEGWEVVGLAMHLWEGEGTSGNGKRCCGERDLLDARAVAARLEIPCYVLDFQKEFHREVLLPVARGYRGGSTPIPCILCNSEVKFRHLQDMARRIGAVYLATGHYARVARDRTRGRYRLLKGVDPRKDQSYYLFNLDQQQLGSLLLPLGDRTKDSIRALARKWGLPVSEKPESQDLCFASSGGYREMIDRIAPAGSRRPGEIVDKRGNILGRHDGIEGFTIGQRKGLGVSLPEPTYVIGLEPDRNRVVVGTREELECRVLVATGVNWIAYDPPEDEFEATARIRSQHPGAPARILPGKDGRVRVEFHRPQGAIAPGQAVVFYNGDEVLGGGWIAGSG